MRNRSPAGEVLVAHFHFRRCTRHDLARKPVKPKKGRIGHRQGRIGISGTKRARRLGRIRRERCRYPAPLSVPAMPSGQTSATRSASRVTPETPPGRAPCDALPSVRSRVPRGARFSERGDGGTLNSRRRPDRRGPTPTSRVRGPRQPKWRDKNRRSGSRTTPRLARGRRTTMRTPRGCRRRLRG
jgi:hypothetical protein